MQERKPETLQEELVRQKARLSELEAERERILQRIAELEAERERILQRIAEIRSIAELGAKTQAGDVPAPPTELTPLPKPYTSAEKIALFRSLFRGRADVYPTQWLNTRKGTRGYSPACAKEWVRGVCEKPRVKCGECPNQAFIPVTSQTIHDHFHGKHVAGVYPLLEDETCWFLAVDFDKGTWREDVEAFIRTCQKKGVPFAVERSRSGNGAHVWFFFQAPVAASIARKMGCFLITETMVERHDLAMTSYDRLFPNQDTMPRGGFGTSSHCPSRTARDSRVTPCSWTRPGSRTRTSGHSWLPWSAWHRSWSTGLPGKPLQRVGSSVLTQTKPTKTIPELHGNEDHRG